MTISPSLQALFIGYYDKMFKDKPLEARDELSYVLKGILKKITTPVKGTTPLGLTFLEQNPNKNSIYGQRAQQGAKIMWVIANNRMSRRERWLGRVEDGVWHGK